MPVETRFGSRKRRNMDPYPITSSSDPNIYTSAIVAYNPQIQQIGNTWEDPNIPSAPLAIETFVNHPENPPAVNTLMAQNQKSMFTDFTQRHTPIPPYLHPRIPINTVQIPAQVYSPFIQPFHDPTLQTSQETSTIPLLLQGSFASPVTQVVTPSAPFPTIGTSSSAMAAQALAQIQCLSQNQLPPLTQATSQAVPPSSMGQSTPFFLGGMQSSFPLTPQASASIPSFPGSTQSFPSFTQQTSTSSTPGAAQSLPFHTQQTSASPSPFSWGAQMFSSFPPQQTSTQAQAQKNAFTTGMPSMGFSNPPFMSQTPITSTFPASTATQFPPHTGSRWGLTQEEMKAWGIPTHSPTSMFANHQATFSQATQQPPSQPPPTSSFVSYPFTMPSNFHQIPPPQQQSSSHFTSYLSQPPFASSFPTSIPPLSNAGMHPTYIGQPQSQVLQGPPYQQVASFHQPPPQQSYIPSQQPTPIIPQQQQVSSHQLQQQIPIIPQHQQAVPYPPPPYPPVPHQ